MARALILNYFNSDSKHLVGSLVVANCYEI